MSKEELEKIFIKLNIKADEGIQNMDNNDCYPRVVYFDYVWEDITASGNKYNTKVTYQISFRSDMPRHPKLIELKEKLLDYDLHPIIYHEYIKEKREWHSYFSLEILENVISKF